MYLISIVLVKTTEIDLSKICVLFYLTTLIFTQTIFTFDLTMLFTHF